MFNAKIKLSSGEYETVTVYSINDITFDSFKFQRLGSGRNDKKQRINYLDCICCLDTETSKSTHYDDEHIEQPDAVWIYQWAVKIGSKYIAGRTADEILDLFQMMIDFYHLDKTHRIVIWIHNAAFDLSYLINGLYSRFNGAIELFSVAPHKPIKCTVAECIEIRCSWKLVNKSLAAWCKDIKTEHEKQVGAIDYNALITPNDSLDSAAWNYMLNDVACQYDCLQYTLATETLASVPMTSTGYVRRAMRKAAARDRKWKQKYHDILLTADQYKLIKQTFTGGYTHANSWNLGIWEDIEAYDAASMYPAVQATELFPMSKFNWRRVNSIAELDDLCLNPYLAVVMEIYVEDLKLHNIKTWNPYLSFSKISGSAIKETELDNGKVISAPRALLHLTEIDYKWLRKQYDFSNMRIIKVMTAIKRPLPDWFLKELKKWYVDKTLLKGVKDPENKRRYMESKQRLNAVYGMTATDIIHDKIIYDESECCWKLQNMHSDDGIAEILEKAKRPYSKEFLPYQWGLYCTAYARDRLFTFAECCGLPLYCDTDSVKGAKWDYEKLAAFNKDIEEKSRAAGFVAPDQEGIEHVIGIFEPDGKYKKFSALHAKCYGYVDYDDELHAVIAGVTPNNGQPKNSPEYITREMELGRLEELQDGKIFTACGGTRSVYIEQPHSIYINGCFINSYGGCAIMNTTYEIGGTFDLMANFLLHNPENRL